MTTKQIAEKIIDMDKELVSFLEESSFWEINDLLCFYKLDEDDYSSEEKKKLNCILEKKQKKYFNSLGYSIKFETGQTNQLIDYFLEENTNKWNLINSKVVTEDYDFYHKLLEIMNITSYPLNYEELIDNDNFTTFYDGKKIIMVENK